MSTEWVRVAALDDLRQRGRKVVKVGGKQIAIFQNGKNADGHPKLYACNNRCPHEGFPLVEGSLTAGEENGACLLTCNWHNWKFNLETGDTLVGGDSVRLYPVKLDGGEIFVDVTDPPPQERIEKALTGVELALPRHEYDRIAREVARLKAAGGAPAEAVAKGVAYAHDRFEYGMTHAFAATPDWLETGRRLAGNDAESLVPIVESVGHMSWDALQGTRYPFTDRSAAYDADALVQAIEHEDEEQAVALVNGALDAGLAAGDLQPALARAALAHYQDFGHAIIYVYKVAQLDAQLDGRATRPLLHSLVRRLVYATREDLIPEFKAYRPAVDAWETGGDEPPGPASDYASLSVAKVLTKIMLSAQRGPELFPVLLEAAALQFLRYRTDMDSRTDNSIAENVNWLDFTHAITFANAGRWAAKRDPALWPAVLLQIGCFLGRNAAHQDMNVTLEQWEPDGDPTDFLDSTLKAMFDHSIPEYIISCHYVKLACAIREEIQNNPAGGHGRLATAALNRMLNHPPKRKQILRTANQSLDFVAREG